MKDYKNVFFNKLSRVYLKCERSLGETETYYQLYITESKIPMRKELTDNLICL